MFDDMKSHVKDWTDEEEVSNYLRKLLHKEAFDQKGLIYGMGMRFTPFPTRVRASLRASLSSWQKKNTERKITGCTLWSRNWLRRSSARSAIFTKVYRKRRLLQRLRLQHAGSSAGALHPDVRLRAYRRLECTPDGGTDQHRQDHPPGVQECQR